MGGVDGEPRLDLFGMGGPDFTGFFARPEEKSIFRLAIVQLRPVIVDAEMAEVALDLVLEFLADFLLGAFPGFAHGAHHRPAAQPAGMRQKQPRQFGDEHNIAVPGSRAAATVIRAGLAILFDVCQSNSPASKSSCGIPGNSGPNLTL